MQILPLYNVKIYGCNGGFMPDGIDINILTGRAKEIASAIDSKNVKDNKLSDKEISIFLAECTNNGIEITQESWYSKCEAKINEHFEGLKKKISEFTMPKQQDTAVRDATYVAPAPEVKIMKAKGNHSIDQANLLKQELSTKMYKKWSSRFPNSPLKQDFYEKVYDIIETLNVKVPNTDWDKDKYSSPQEQAMDEVIAIFAGESKLNPKSKNGIYNGIFQLASPGLTEAKNWAKKNPNVEGMDNINDSMTITKFRNSSGSLQLDYLVAYIGKCKEYSKIGKNESITPGQLWAMIKYPFKGKNNKLVLQKTNAIDNVFKNSKIEYGIKS